MVALAPLFGIRPTNRYSAPRPFAFQMVTVKGYVGKAVIVAGGQAVATHERSLPRHTAVLDPRHYLATPGRKPGALDRAPVFRDWELPAGFAAFRATLGHQHGTTTGARHFARVLQSLGDHPLRRVGDAVESCRGASLFSAEAVIRRVRVLAAVEATRGVPLPSEAAMAPPAHVPRPDPSRFDLLLDRGGDPEPSGGGDTVAELQAGVSFA